MSLWALSYMRCHLTFRFWVMVRYWIISECQHIWWSSFRHGTWLIFTWHMTHFYVAHDSYLRGTWLILTWDMTHFYVGSDVGPGVLLCVDNQHSHTHTHTHTQIYTHTHTHSDLELVVSHNRIRLHSMSQVPHQNESCPISAFASSYMLTLHCQRMNKSCLILDSVLIQWVIVPHMNVSCPTSECALPYALLRFLMSVSTEVRESRWVFPQR